MLIRTFDLDRDFEAVIALWARSGSGIQLGSSDTRDEILKKVQRDPDLFLVAVDDDEVVGAVMGGFDGRRGLVYHLAVTPSERRRGMGRALMDEIEKRFRAKGCLKAYLLVTPDNGEALSFYHDLGWEIMPLIPMGKRFS